MRVFIRTDASPQIGTGHLTRCRTLAGELRTRGADVRFICRAHEGHVSAVVEREGFQVLILPPPPVLLQNEDGYATWLGVPQEQDAVETLAAIGAERADCLIVDHYAIDAQWERAVRPKVDRIMAIDDLANRRHDCEILLDQSYGADASGHYEALLPSYARPLLGPRYAILHPEYRECGPRLRSRVERILVFFGGADLTNATCMALDALCAPELAHLSVDVVVGPANPHREAIDAQAARRGRVHVHEPRAHLADLMHDADLAIGAGGATTWERLCLGVPAIIVSIADNQVLASRALAAAGLVEYAGSFESLTADDLHRTILALVSDGARLSLMSSQGPKEVDGLGAARVAELLMPTPTQDLQLRPARLSDAAVFFSWANDPDVRRQSLSTDKITWDAHVSWFNERVASARSQLFVLEARGGVPVGQIRFDIQPDNVARLSYSLDPVARGRRWGMPLVISGLKQLRRLGAFEIHAEVKEANLPSQAIFDRLGFRYENLAERGIRIYRASHMDF